MNRFFLLIVTSFFFVLSYGQEKSLEKFADMDGVSSVYISKAMLSLMPDMNVEGVNIGNIASKLDNIQILSTEKKEVKEKMEREVQALTSKGKIEELMRMKDEGDNVFIYLKEIEKKKNEFILVNSDQNELTVIIITGELALKDIQNIIKK